VGEYDVDREGDDAGDASCGIVGDGEGDNEGDGDGDGSFRIHWNSVAATWKERAEDISSSFLSSFLSLFLCVLTFKESVVCSVQPSSTPFNPVPFRFDRCRRKIAQQVKQTIRKARKLIQLLHSPQPRSSVGIYHCPLTPYPDLRPMHALPTMHRASATSNSAGAQHIAAQHSTAHRSTVYCRVAQRTHLVPHQPRSQPDRTGRLVAVHVHVHVGT
jgi:hypothetical protein